MTNDILYELVMDTKKRHINKKDDIENQKDTSMIAEESIEKMGTVDIPVATSDNPRGNIFFLNIIGHIEGHMLSSPETKTTKYEHVIPTLVSVAENRNIDGVLILLNTAGGDVEAGLAISEIISKIGKPTVSLVIGGGHSIGVPLAVAADYSYIAPSATMTIHPVRMNGLVIGAPQTFSYFEKMQDRISDFIISNSNIKKSKLKELMMKTGNLTFDVGTLLIGLEAVEVGLIDEVGGVCDALEKLYSLIDKK